MRYTKETLINAIHHIAPQLEKSEMAIPKKLQVVAEVFLIESLNDRSNPSYDSRIAMMIAAKSLKELNKDGEITYGTENFEFDSNKRNYDHITI